MIAGRQGGGVDRDSKVGTASKVITIHSFGSIHHGFEPWPVHDRIFYIVLLPPIFITPIPPTIISSRLPITASLPPSFQPGQLVNYSKFAISRNSLPHKVDFLHSFVILRL